MRWAQLDQLLPFGGVAAGVCGASMPLPRKWTRGKALGIEFRVPLFRDSWFDNDLDAAVTNRLNKTTLDRCSRSETAFAGN